MKVPCTFVIFSGLVSLSTALHRECPGHCRQVSHARCANSPCQYGCETGWYGAGCNRRCHNLCFGSTCNQYTGTCTHGYHSVLKSILKYHHAFSKYSTVQDAIHKFNRIPLKNVGKRSAENCLIKDGESCTCCMSKYRGENCELFCDNCITFNNVEFECEYFCKPGFYGDMCENRCPETCNAGNSGDPICKEHELGVECSNGCLLGYYGQKCDTTCSGNCKNKICYQRTGSCVNCTDGFHGYDCNIPCNNTCVDNICQRNGSCDQACPINCLPARFSNKTCVRDHDGNVECKHGCIHGFYGRNCELRCRERCKSCHQLTGECLTCKNQWYGDQCDNNCAGVCKGGCSQDGSCRGCNRGFYGASCEQQCGKNCAEQECTASVAAGYHCLKGCVEGFQDTNCEKPCPDNCDTCPQDSLDACTAKSTDNEENAHLLPILAVVIPVVFLVIVLSLTVFGVWFRRKTKPERRTQGAKERDEEESQPCFGGETSSNIEKEETGDQQHLLKRLSDRNSTTPRSSAHELQEGKDEKQQHLEKQPSDRNSNTSRNSAPDPQVDDKREGDIICGSGKSLESSDKAIPSEEPKEERGKRKGSLENEISSDISQTAPNTAETGIQGPIEKENGEYNRDTDDDGDDDDDDGDDDDDDSDDEEKFRKWKEKFAPVVVEIEARRMYRSLPKAERQLALKQ